MSSHPDHEQPAATERPAAHGRQQPAPAAAGRHYWRVGYSLGEFGQTDEMITTAERSFAAAEKAAEEEHEAFHRQWPGPVEVKSIEYLGER